MHHFLQHAHAELTLEVSKYTLQEEGNVYVFANNENKVNFNGRSMERWKQLHFRRITFLCAVTFRA